MYWGHALQNGPETWFTPWRSTVGFPSFGLTQDQRLRFLSSYQKEEMSDSELCREFGVSRPTGYRWITRYKESGPEGLLNLSSKPHSCSHETPETIENAILALRGTHPSWGARKLKARLEQLDFYCDRIRKAVCLPTLPCLC